MKSYNVICRVTTGGRGLIVLNHQKLLSDGQVEAKEFPISRTVGRFLRRYTHTVYLKAAVKIDNGTVRMVTVNCVYTASEIQDWISNYQAESVKPKVEPKVDDSAQDEVESEDGELALLRKLRVLSASYEAEKPPVGKKAEWWYANRVRVNLIIDKVQKGWDCSRKERKFLAGYGIKA